MLRQEYAMTGTQGVVAHQAAMKDLPNSEVIETRFGSVTIERRNPINFPNGLLGMPDKFLFSLVAFPSKKLSKFKLLQSLDDLALSFITLPIALDNPFIDKADIDIACKDLDIAQELLSMLLIVTVTREASGVRLSANTRAPLFLHLERKLASQYVFHNTKYEIRHPITL